MYGRTHLYSDGNNTAESDKFKFQEEAQLHQWSFLVHVLDLRATVEALTSERNWQRSSILAVGKEGCMGPRRRVDKLERKVK